MAWQSCAIVSAVRSLRKWRGTVSRIGISPPFLCLYVYGSESMRNQTRARRTAIVMLILFFASFLPGNACFAGRPLMFLHGRHHAGHGHCDHPGCRAHHRHRVAPSYRETYKYMNWRYPKYTGAFHANYFQTMGVAPGDVGFRGNGVYMTPW